jgi:hypothetical protein
MVVAARQCPGVRWGGAGGAEAAPAVLALISAAAAQAAALRSRVAAALADPALLLGGIDPAPLAAYGLLWGLAPFVEAAAVEAAVAVEAALLEGG